MIFFCHYHFILPAYPFYFFVLVTRILLATLCASHHPSSPCRSSKEAMLGPTPLISTSRTPFSSPYLQLPSSHSQSYLLHKTATTFFSVPSPISLTWHPARAHASREWRTHGGQHGHVRHADMVGNTAMTSY